MAEKTDEKEVSALNNLYPPSEPKLSDKCSLETEALTLRLVFGLGFNLSIVYCVLVMSFVLGI